jgi:hypothetical protein
LEEAVAQMDVGDTPLSAFGFGESFSRFVLSFFSCLEQEDKGFICYPVGPSFTTYHKQQVGWWKQRPKTAQTV